VGSFTTEHRAALVEMLARITPGDLRRTQFYSSGAEAVEAAVRLAKAATKRTEIVGFWGGFHGKTGGVLPLLSGTFKHGLGPLMPGMYSSPYASCGNCALGKEPTSCAWACVNFLKRKIELETTNDVAAIIVEPVQGTAGNVIPPVGYLRELRAFADSIGALLIADEMITGFGRTGTMFGVDHDGVVPDIMLLGKGFGGGFPMSGLVAREEVAFATPWANPSGSSSSYGGNPLAAAAAREAINIILEDDLVAHSARLGARLLVELQRWEREIPMVRRARGRGLMLGFDLVDPASGRLLDKARCRRIFDACLDRGVLAMIYNPEVRINPPLVIDEAVALEGFGMIEEVLRDVSSA
jgi:4-aminobutyrate aminotransferase / (S)-3-amino-2-methylpropionate transaminase / 5-aminovalerate transaminase